jgi:hypothetical protein
MILIVSLLAVLIFALAEAQARTPISDSLAAASTYWAHSPEGSFALPCNGTPSVVFTSVPADTPSDAVGWTSHGTCTIYLRADYWKTSHDGMSDYLGLCTTITHELGHLILQPNYFAASDPSNPDHSSDETNVMYPSVSINNTPQSCYQAEGFWTYSSATPSPRASVSDELVTWRTVTAPAHSHRFLVCAYGERLQSKLWTLSGSVRVKRLTPNTLSLLNPSGRSVIVRGACEPIY